MCERLLTTATTATAAGKRAREAPLPTFYPLSSPLLSSRPHSSRVFPLLPVRTCCSFSPLLLRYRPSSSSSLQACAFSSASFLRSTRGSVSVGDGGKKDTVKSTRLRRPDTCESSLRHSLRYFCVRSTGPPHRNSQVFLAPPPHRPFTRLSLETLHVCVHVFFPFGGKNPDSSLLWMKKQYLKKKSFVIKSSFVFPFSVFTIRKLPHQSPATLSLSHTHREGGGGYCDCAAVYV